MKKKSTPRNIDDVNLPPPPSLVDALDSLTIENLRCRPYDYYRALERVSVERLSAIVAGALHPDERIRAKARHVFRKIDLNAPLCPCKNGEVSPFD